VPFVVAERPVIPNICASAGIVIARPVFEVKLVSVSAAPPEMMLMPEPLFWRISLPLIDGVAPPSMRIPELLLCRAVL
jgi:hypothetical protein